MNRIVSSRHLHIAVAMLSMSAAAFADTPDVAGHRSLLPEQIPAAWSNPALIPYEYGTSLTTVGAGGDFGSAICSGRFDADTYLRSETNVITGFAGYANGRLSRTEWAETVDADMTGPYRLYASGPGHLQRERYRFGGSYTSLWKRWGAGIAASYDAGLYYRTTDPRPRDITGKLTINAGASYLLGRQLLSLSAGYMRYSQSASISFVNELGVNTIYHLTGLGNAYTRFTGTGSSVYYTGNSVTGQLALFPARNGIFAIADASSAKITNVIRDLNKLPMASLSTIDMSATAGWKNNHWVATAFAGWQRRRGTENIFGDAATGQYPLIGHLTMYSRTLRRAGVRGAAQLRTGRWTLSAAASSQWFSLFEQHLSPLRQRKATAIISSITLQAIATLPRGGVVTMRAGGTLTSPLTASASGMTASDSNLGCVIDALTREISPLTHRRQGADASVEMLFPIAGKYMIGADMACIHSLTDLNSYSFSLKFIF